MQRKLIINPKKSQDGSYQPVNQNGLKKELFDKVLGPNAKYPMIIAESQLGRLIGNIEYKVKSVTEFRGYEAKDRKEAEKYLTKVADKIYGKDWPLKLLKSEVMYGKAKVYGIAIPNDELVQQVSELLKNVATIEVNTPKANKNQTTEGSKTEEVNE